MSRLPRLDAPGLLQHVISRGIERTSIYRDDCDRDAFLRRLEQVLEETQTRCYAWCLMDNHFHLLLKTGDVPLGRFMNRLLGGYSLCFNRRHKRAGHLFQNRYKSFVCQDDGYFLALVRYIHLNPLRSMLVPTLEGLESYRYSGHRHLMGQANLSWQDGEAVLGLFGRSLFAARSAYINFLAAGDSIDAAVCVLKDARMSDLSRTSDVRIFGDGDLIKPPTKVGTVESPASISPVALVTAAADLLGAPLDLIKSRSRSRTVVNARAIMAGCAQKIGVKGSALAKELGVTEACISKAAQRGAVVLSKRPELMDDLINKLRS